ncbi:hypothetical protein Tco_0260275 [Tanacetum coccineum]
MRRTHYSHMITRSSILSNKISKDVVHKILSAEIKSRLQASQVIPQELHPDEMEILLNLRKKRESYHLMQFLASSSEVPSVLEFLQRRKLEAKKYYLNWSNGLINSGALNSSDKKNAKGQEVAASEVL